MLSLPASMKWIRSRIAEKKWQHHFSHYKSLGIFSDALYVSLPACIRTEHIKDEQIKV